MSWYRIKSPTAAPSRSENRGGDETEYDCFVSCSPKLCNSNLKTAKNISNSPPNAAKKIRNGRALCENTKDVRSQHDSTNQQAHYGQPGGPATHSLTRHGVPISPRWPLCDSYHALVAPIPRLLRRRNVQIPRERC